MIVLTIRLSVNVEKHIAMVKAVVNRLLLSRRLFYLSTEREDLYQIGWMSLNNCIKTFDENRGIKFDTYATTAIRNAVNNELHKLSKRRMYSIAVEPSVNEASIVKDREIREVIDTVEHSKHFSPKERTVFWLRFIDEQRFFDIGKRIGVSRETARRIYNKSLSKLKELMTNE